MNQGNLCLIYRQFNVDYSMLYLRSTLNLLKILVWRKNMKIGWNIHIVLGVVVMLLIPIGT